MVDQNQQMVSEYFAKNGAPLRPWLERPDGSFLHLGAPAEDCEMAASASPDRNSGFLSSTMTSLSDDRNSADSMDKKVKEEDEARKVKVKVEAEESAMQQQIVDMYMRSMHQFTESLAKMKLPMDLDKAAAEDEGDFIHNSEEKIEIELKKKKDSCKVFYGSRAFF